MIFGWSLTSESFNFRSRCDSTNLTQPSTQCLSRVTQGALGTRLDWLVAIPHVSFGVCNIWIILLGPLYPSCKNVSASLTNCYLSSCHSRKKSLLIKFKYYTYQKNLLGIALTNEKLKLNRKVTSTHFITGIKQRLLGSSTQNKYLSEQKKICNTAVFYF